MSRLSTLVSLFTLFSLPISTLASPIYPADPDALSRQWHLQKIEAYEAWSRTPGSPQVVVAVIDTGVDLNHFDLQANIWTNPGERPDGADNDGNIYVDDLHGWDFLDGDNDPNPNLDEREVHPEAVHHGTMIAGIIAATSGNGIGGAGVAPQVKIMPLRALDSRGRGNVGTVMEAMRYAIANGAHIINLSFVGNGFDPELFALLRHAAGKGILVVAAVGNQETVGQDLDVSPLYPVCYKGEAQEDVVLGVAALDREDLKPRFSNFGANCVDLTAPGVQIYGPKLYRPSRGFEEPFGVFSGSSMAAPQVSGVAALIKSLNPNYQAAELREILLASADPMAERDPAFKDKLGRGRLNARQALELAATGRGFSITGAGIPHLLAAVYSQAAPEVNVLRVNGSLARTFAAYAPTFRGGVRLATGDLDHDGSDEIIAGAGRGGGPHVRIFKADGTLTSSFFAYDPRFRGGVNVAVGDLDGDGRAEIIAGAGRGGGPHVRIFDGSGRFQGGWFAYDKGFRGGVSVTVADLNLDGRAEIITAPGPGPGTHKNEIKVFDRKGVLLHRFSTFPQGFSNGLTVAAGDLDGDGLSEIVVSHQGGVVPEVRVYSSSGSWQRAFLVYPEAFLGGVNLAIGDLDRDGKAEIVVGPGPGGGPHVKVLDGFGRARDNFFPFTPSFKGGVSVGIIKL